MEKFGRWTDHHTGRHPWVSKRVSRGILSLLLGVFLCLVRLPLALLVYYVLLLFELLRFPGSLCALLARFCLFLSSVTTIDERVDRELAREANHVRCQLVVANSLSYLDVLYWCHKCAGRVTFVVAGNQWSTPVEDAAVNSADRGIANNDVLVEEAGIVARGSVARGVREAMRVVGSERRRAADTLERIDDAFVEREFARGNTVVVLPEGTTSNGSVVLYCVPVLRALSAERRAQCRVATLQYSDVAATYTGLQSRMAHNAALCTRASVALRVRHVHPRADSDDGGNTHIYEHLSTAHRPQAKIGANIKHDFLEYYHHRRKRKVD
jgi:hypothetical protein